MKILSAEEIAWIAGFLEGEGCILTQRFSVRISANQVQRWPLEKLQNIVGGSLYFTPSNKVKHPNYNHKYTWQLDGDNAIKLINTIYPLLSPKRQTQALTALHAKALLEKRKRSITGLFKCGHPFILDNTYESLGIKRCKKCTLARQKKRRIECQQTM